MSVNRTISCPNCGNPNTLPALSCQYCNRDFSDLPENRKAALSATQLAEIATKANQVILTTAPILEGYHVIETLEIVTAECVFGINILRDILAGLTDVFGGRSESSQRVLRDARRTCLAELKKEAAEIGADAVIGVDLNYNEFSGGGKSMLFLVASGTAVRIKQNNSDN